MNLEELKEARQKYRMIQKELREQQLELETLEKSKEVLRYLELLAYKEQVPKDKETILKNSFQHIANNTLNSSNIYVLMGSYYHTKNSDESILIKTEKTKIALSNYYNIYWDLETEKAYHVEKEDILTFEENNVIIRFGIPSKFIDESIYRTNFYKIQLEYFKMLTHINIETAKEKIKKRSPIYIKNKY